MKTHSAPRIALLLQDLGGGGVERCFVNLARGFANNGVRVDLYVSTVHGDAPHFDFPGVNVVVLQPGSQRQRVQHLAGLLESTTPSHLLAAIENDCRLALQARSANNLQIIFVASLNYSGQLTGRGAGPWRRWKRNRELRTLFGQADGVFCVSQGVAADMASILRRDESQFPALPNPVITPEFAGLSREPVSHPWFEPGQPPVVLGVGRLSRIKNFPLLVRAFALARKEMDLRLIVLGEGKHRALLERTAEKLGVADDLSLPGHIDNPYPYMKKASLFALSSLWEGFGNVVVEALACGTPVVATDCPSGPAEILQGGRYGLLVPVDDEIALAQAILQSLNTPTSESMLLEAAKPYSLKRSTTAYLAALGIRSDREPE